MSTIHTAKAASGLCFLFAGASLISLYRGSSLLFLALLLLSAASVYFGSRFENLLAVRLFSALFPLAAVFLADSIAEYILVGAVVLYISGSVVLGEFRASYYGYSLHLRAVSVLLLVIFIVGGALNEQKDAIHYDFSVYSVFAFGIAAILIGGFALRQLRFGQGSGALGKVFDISILLIAPGVALLLALLITSIPKVSPEFLKTLALPFAWAFALFVSLFAKITDVISKNHEIPHREHESGEVAEEGEFSPEDFGNTENDPGLSIDLNALITVLLILAAIALVVYFVILLRRKRPERSDHATTADGTFSSIETSAEKLRVAPKECGKRIRKIYCRYLKFLRSRGYLLKEEETSLEILLESGRIAHPEPATKLRELYIRARYNEEDGLTDDDVKRAKEYYYEAIK